MASLLANVDTDTDPRANGRKVAAILAAEDGHADLFRTVEAGPSGQRARLHVGRVRVLPYGPYELAVIDPRTAHTVGYARYDAGNGWSITADLDGDGLAWWGYAPESLAVGVDALVNGEHAATGRHDSRRIDGARWRSAESVHADSARKHAAACGPCRTAGESRGWLYCVAG